MEEAYCHKTNLEEYGQGGYMMYRIPGIVVTGKGTVLAYYEARKGRGDWTKQDVYVRRSEDSGRTWSGRKLLVGGREDETIHNVVMIADPAGGIVHMLWHRNYRECRYQRSADDGRTWSSPIDITSVYERFRPDYDWNVIAAGPGHGIRLTSGRLFVPVWLSCGGESHRPSVVSCIFSDDGGQTWERGDIIGETETFRMPNETTAVQLAGGEVLMNMRHESEPHWRAVTVSDNGSSGWSVPRLDPNLPDPICFASLLRYAEERKHGWNGILFANCAFDGGDNLQKRMWRDGSTEYYWGPQARIDLTVRLSLDECASWAYSRLLEPFAGYADMAVSPDLSTIYCLYERDWVGDDCTQTKHMAAAVFNLAWPKGEKV